MRLGCHHQLLLAADSFREPALPLPLPLQLSLLLPLPLLLPLLLLLLRPPPLVRPSPPVASPCGRVPAPSALPSPSSRSPILL